MGFLEIHGDDVAIFCFNWSLGFQIVLCATDAFAQVQRKAAQMKMVSMFQSFWFQMRSIQFLLQPRTPMTSIFEGRPPKTRPFPFKTRVIYSKWLVSRL